MENDSRVQGQSACMRGKSRGRVVVTGRRRAGGWTASCDGKIYPVGAGWRTLEPWPDAGQGRVIQTAFWDYSHCWPMPKTHRNQSRKSAKSPHKLNWQFEAENTLKRGYGSLQTAVSYVNAWQRTSTFLLLQAPPSFCRTSTVKHWEPSTLCFRP